MELQTIRNKIYEIRDFKVMLDYDLAQLYEVLTKNLNLAVKRNLKRFPADFMFQLTKDEWESLRLQFETLEKGRGKHTKYFPHAFTEQGVAMLSAVLNSDKSIEVNIAIMRAFVFIRQYALSHKDLTEKLEELENRYNRKFADVYEALKYLMDDKQNRDEWSSRKRIGFKK